MENMSNSGRPSMEENEEDDTYRVTISTLQAREEQIEKKKVEVKEKVELKLGRAEEETRRLTHIWEELQELDDPLRKEVATVRKRVDIVNKEVKSLGQNCQKKEKEYRDALEAFNQKSVEKAQLVTALMELLTQSENIRMKKLEELNKNVH